jgi:hypothetical protein
MSTRSCGRSHEHARLGVSADDHDDPPLSIGCSQLERTERCSLPNRRGLIGPSFHAVIHAYDRFGRQMAVASQDSLASHPAVAGAVGRPWDNPLFYEKVNYAPSRAHQRVSGDEHAFLDALEAPSNVTAALRTWARTSTSTTTRRCAAACPDSPLAAWARALPEHTAKVMTRRAPVTLRVPLANHRQEMLPVPLAESCRPGCLGP